MKTTQIEVREVLGEYDDKIKIYREPDNTIVIQTDTGSVKIKDGTLTLSGSIKIDGLKIGTTTSPSLITLEPPALWLLGQIFVSSVISAGYADAWGVIYVNNALGLPTITFVGSSGNATIKGGINLGTATGAAPGQLKTSGNISLGDPRLLCPSSLLVRNAANDAYQDVLLNSLFLNNNAIYNADSELTIQVDNDRNVLPQADLLPAGFLSTHGNELLATDIIRHTLTLPETYDHGFIESWNKATMPKCVSLTTALYNAQPLFHSQAKAGMVAYYDGTYIAVLEGTVPWAQGDTVTITMVYEK